MPQDDDISKLHPGHVGYVAAMGDSITAAFAARASLKEGRDISWSVGVGSPEQLTLPALLRYYNPKVGGASTKAVLPNRITHLPHGDYHPATDHLNVAESSGAVHRNSMVEQWALLGEQTPKYGEAFNSSWKVLTVWMMANDVCGDCSRPLNSKEVDAWAAGYEALLHNVSVTWSRVLVNLVSTLDLSNIARIQRSKLGCRLEHKVGVSARACVRA